MSHRVLHVLSQRPRLTGSGITLEATVREAAAAGWEQAVVVGTSREDPRPRLGTLSEDAVHPLVFGEGALDFELPGMSDVMPYPSSTFASLDASAVARYGQAWRDHLRRTLAAFRPDVIHAHHAWILSSLLKSVAPEIPVVVQSHATGLRQMAICPHLADDVVAGLRRNDAFLALHTAHARALASAIGVSEDAVEIVGAGYRDELFRPPTGDAVPREGLLVVGKWSRAKGLPWLLDAYEVLAATRPGLVLHVAGSGAGEEAEAVGARMRAMGGERVVLHGQLDQTALAALMRRVRVFVLPSLYEGLPLVLIEAAASGCRVVATDLDVVRDDLAPALGATARRVRLPRLRDTDVPLEEDTARFVRNLATAIAAALDEPVTSLPPTSLASFTWKAVFGRIERVWRRLAATEASPRPTGR